MTASPTVPTGFDPTDPMLCEGAIPLEEFVQLRRTAPVWWVSQTEGASAGFNDDALGDAPSPVRSTASSPKTVGMMETRKSMRRDSRLGVRLVLLYLMERSTAM